MNPQAQELLHEWDGIRVKRWLNAPRFPSWDSRYPKLRITRGEYRRTIEESLDFHDPKTWWTFGKKKSAKSTFIERIMKNVIGCGGVGLDWFSSDDNEGLGWLRSGYNMKMLLLCGDSVDLAFEKEIPNVAWMHASEFQVSTIDDYQLILTVPKFYSRRDEMYVTLSKGIDLFRTRADRGWNKTAMIGVRESMELLNSRWVAGAVREKTQAEQDFININAQAEHNGGGLALDSLRPMSIVIHVRELADYVVIKRLGRLQVPKELDYVFRKVRWRYARRMPRKDFILYTDSDDIFYGDFDPFDWHVKRGEPMALNLGISVIPNSKAATRDAKKVENARSDEYLELHRKIIPLLEQGKNQSQIAADLGINRGTVIRHVKDHQSGSCKCGA